MKAFHRSARPRQRPSIPANWIFANVLTSQTIIDFGCGRGDDATYLEDAGYTVSRYDPVSFPDLPTHHHDFGLCAFVLNVVPSEAERKMVVAQLTKLCHTVLITARNGADFPDVWEEWVDGFKTGSGTFQKGIGEEEILKLTKNFVEAERVWTERSTTFLLGKSKGITSEDATGVEED